MDEHYRVKGGRVRSVRLGSLTQDDKKPLSIWPLPYIWQRRANLTGVTLVDSTIPRHWQVNNNVDHEFP